MVFHIAAARPATMVAGHLPVSRAMKIAPCVISSWIGFHVPLLYLDRGRLLDLTVVEPFSFGKRAIMLAWVTSRCRGSQTPKKSISSDQAFSGIAVALFYGIRPLLPGTQQRTDVHTPMK